LKKDSFNKIAENLAVSIIILTFVDVKREDDINNLRIEHFVRLYREAIANSRPFTAQQLAQESGFRSYSTFGTAFKQRMGQNVSSWMHDAAK
jgi:AraC-like DNA-binding protein